MVAFHVYPEGVLTDLLQPAGAPFDLDGYTIKVMLLSSSYAPSNAHKYKSDITNEISFTGYTAGGQALSGVSVVRAGANVTLSANNPVWSGVTFSGVRYAVIYLDSGADDAHKPLIAYVDMQADTGSTANDYTLKWSGGASSGSIYQFQTS